METNANQQFEINNGLLGMNKYVLIKLIVLHNKQNENTYTKELKKADEERNEQLEDFNDIVSTKYENLQNWGKNMRNKLIKKRHEEIKNKIKELEKEHDNTYKLMDDIFNNQITVKHLFGISQELINYKKHYYYIENI
jgi:hypothetical protein